MRGVDLGQRLGGVTQPTPHRRQHLQFFRVHKTFQRPTVGVTAHNDVCHFQRHHRVLDARPHPNRGLGIHRHQIPRRAFDKHLTGPGVTQLGRRHPRIDATNEQDLRRLMMGERLIHRAPMWKYVAAKTL